MGAVRSAPSLIAAAAVGAKPRTVPPELRQACDSAAMAVVFPAPAGASASATRRPLVAISVTRATWPGLRFLPRAAESASAISTSAAVDGAAAVECGGVQDAPLGGEDLGAGVEGGSVARVHAGAVAAAKRGGFGHVAVVDARQWQGYRLGERRGGDALRECVIGGMPGRSHDALRFGEHMMALPGGARHGHGGDGLMRPGADPFRGGGSAGVVAPAR